MPLDINTAIVVVIVLLLFSAIIVTAIYAFTPVPLPSGGASIQTINKPAPKGASLASYTNDPNLDHDPTPEPVSVSVKPPPRIDPPVSSKDIADKDVPNPLFAQDTPVTYPNCMVHEGAVWSFCNGTKHKRYTMLQPTYIGTIEKCNAHHRNTPCPPRI